jgi:hypothetical protein
MIRAEAVDEERQLRYVIRAVSAILVQFGSDGNGANG